MRPEQEEVVKRSAWELMASRSGAMGASTPPLGDLSGAGEESAASAAAFRREKSMRIRMVLFVEVLGFGSGFREV